MESIKLIFYLINTPVFSATGAGLPPSRPLNTGRKNRFASTLRIWGINLSKGGKCLICIPIYTGVGMQIRHLPPLLRFIPQFAQICIIHELNKF